MLLMNGSGLLLTSFDVVMSQEQASPPFPISMREFEFGDTILNYPELTDRIRYGVPRIPPNSIELVLRSTRMGERRRYKKLGLIGSGVLVFIAAIAITTDTIKNTSLYPIWVNRSFLTLATSGYLWATLMIMMSVNIFSFTKIQFAILNWLRIALTGVMIGIAITLGLAGYMK